MSPCVSMHSLQVDLLVGEVHAQLYQKVRNLRTGRCAGLCQIWLSRKSEHVPCGEAADQSDKCARGRRNVVPVMAIGVAELKRELKSRGGLTEFPEIHQFLDGFYLSRIGIRILIGQHIALHEPQKENHIGARRATSRQPRPSPELDRLPSRTVSRNAKHAPRAERRPS